MVTGGKPVTDESNEVLGEDDLTELRDELGRGSASTGSDGRSSGDGR